MGWMSEERKAKVLEELGEDRVVKAEELARAVRVSERSIYRYMRQLRADGHKILSQAGMGYMVKSQPAPAARVEAA